jgi:hypothetical protein
LFLPLSAAQLHWCWPSSTAQGRWIARRS